MGHKSRQVEKNGERNRSKKGVVMPEWVFGSQYSTKAKKDGIGGGGS